MSFPEGDVQPPRYSDNRPHAKWAVIQDTLYYPVVEYFSGEKQARAAFEAITDEDGGRDDRDWLLVQILAVKSSPERKGS